MEYNKEIENLIKSIPTSLVDFSKPREIIHAPTQASSNFITNKEQGDWAENLIFQAINENSANYVCVKYGKSDDLVAGEPGFETFFNKFQHELDEIGKRPDLLIFRKEDYIEDFGLDISNISHTVVDSYVRKAIAGIEVRSSAFLINHYDKAMREHTENYTKRIIDLKTQILSGYKDLLEVPSRKNYLEVINGLNEETILITDFKTPGWRSTERLLELNNLIKQLKIAIKEVQKRDYLSITPKVEDLKVVYKWIKIFNVPHYYFQVFFDKIYAISFKRILQIISNSDNENVIFSVENDIKNQNKTTIKIKANIGEEIASRVYEPKHSSIRKEMERGRLLFYVTFNGGSACLNIEKLKTVLNINGKF